MRNFAICMALVAACAAAEWVDLTEPALESAWTPALGLWKNDDGVITGVATQTPAVLVSERDFFDLELELEFRTPMPAVGAVAVRAHWLPDAPHADRSLALFGDTWPINTIDPARTGVPEDMDAPEGSPPPLQASDWNTMRIEAKGGETRILINGQERTVHRGEEFIGGKIALVAKPGSTIQYRNIRINDVGREGTWRSLFNGTDFDGWTIWGSEEWSVDDGIIVGRSGPKQSEGYLATEETWTDFRVRGSFKMLGDGNFGLFYHSTIEYNDEQYPMISGLQGEVAPGYPSPTGWVYESYKRGWLVKPDMETYRAYALQPEEWSEIEIRSAGNRVTTWVNGIQVLDLHDEDQQLTQGSFALQLHTGGTDGIQWKDLYVIDK